MDKYSFNTLPQKVTPIKTPNRIINSKIPYPGTNKLIQKLEKVESRSMHGQLPIIWSKAKDYNIYDIGDNKFIDFTSSIFIANIGHSNKRVEKYINMALKNKLISSYAYISKIRLKYINSLIRFVGRPYDKAYLVSAGTEATEAALKLMRLYGKKKSDKKKYIVCFEGNWHGRTYGAQMMSGNKNQKKWIGSQDKFMVHLPFPYPWVMKNQTVDDFFESCKKILNKKIGNFDDIAGFMLESFQGWGAIFYPKDFIKKLFKFSKEHKIAFCFDEMQAGFGRTGKKFGFQHYNVTPDLFCCGKAMGGGVPLSAVIGKKKFLDLPEVGNMSSTHSANPLVCSAGMAVLDEISSKNLIKSCQIKSTIFFRELNMIKSMFPNLIDNIYGSGLIAAIIFKDFKNIKASFICSVISETCMQKGLLVVHTGRESIKLGPPLIIKTSALIEGISVIQDSIKSFLDKHV